MIWLSFLRKPKEGERIKLLWLPSPINCSLFTRNCYIGSEGVVTDMEKDGSFHLRMVTAWLAHTKGPFAYRILPTV